jgi:hypothetical protein
MTSPLRRTLTALTALAMTATLTTMGAATSAGAEQSSRAQKAQTFTPLAAGATIRSMKSSMTLQKARVSVTLGDIYTPRQIRSTAKYATTHVSIYAHQDTRDASAGAVGFELVTVTVDQATTNVTKTRETYGSDNCTINVNVDRRTNRIRVVAPFSCGVVGNPRKGERVRFETIAYTTFTDEAPARARTTLNTRSQTIKRT